MTTHHTQPLNPHALITLAHHLDHHPHLRHHIYTVGHHWNGHRYQGLEIRLDPRGDLPTLLAAWAATLPSWESHGYLATANATGHIVGHLDTHIIEIVGEIPRDHLGEPGRHGYHRWVPIGHNAAPAQPTTEPAHTWPASADLIRSVTSLSLPTVDPDPGCCTACGGFRTVPAADGLGVATCPHCDGTGATTTDLFTPATAVEEDATR